MDTTNELLLKLILYGLLPIWGITGFIDWICHMRTGIERTSGLKESLMHSLMGVQLGIPIVLCLLYRVNALILLLCILAWIAHEVVAHSDVRYATPRRRISIWEVHVHNYMATIPLYLLMLVVIINWSTAVKLLTLDLPAGEFTLQPVDRPHGSPSYLRHYLLFMSVLCVVPYVEENLRCLRFALRNPAKTV
jgi:hypothetical protein